MVVPFVLYLNSLRPRYTHQTPNVIYIQRRLKCFNGPWFLWILLALPDSHNVRQAANVQSLRGQVTLYHCPLLPNQRERRCWSFPTSLHPSRKLKGSHLWAGHTPPLSCLTSDCPRQSGMQQLTDKTVVGLRNTKGRIKRRPLFFRWNAIHYWCSLWLADAGGVFFCCSCCWLTFLSWCIYHQYKERCSSTHLRYFSFLRNKATGWTLQHTHTARSSYNSGYKWILDVSDWTWGEMEVTSIHLCGLCVCGGTFQQSCKVTYIKKQYSLNRYRCHVAIFL